MEIDIYCPACGLKRIDCPACKSIDNFKIPQLKALALSKKTIKENPLESFKIANEILGIYAQETNKETEKNSKDIE